MSFRQLRQIISLSSKQLNAELCYTGRWGLKLSLNSYEEVLWSTAPWIVEDWPELKWQGYLFLHRGHNTVYLVKGDKDFNNSIYRSRLHGLQKMVRWASPQSVGFTIEGKIEEVWGHLLINPWLVRSTDNRWQQRIIVFAALNKLDNNRWPMSLLLEHWEDVRKIIF